MRLRPATTRLYVELDVGDSKSLQSQEAWDSLREASSPFQLPPTLAEWETASQRPPFPARAQAISGFIRASGAQSVASYGVGTAMLERALSVAVPEVRLICTDYATRSVERLTTMFPAATVILRDMREHPLDDVDFHLYHRVDTELDNEERRETLRWLRGTALFVPGGLLANPVTVRQYARSLCGPRFARRRRLVFTGYMRDRRALTELWPGLDSREVQCADLPGWLLTAPK